MRRLQIAALSAAFIWGISTLWIKDYWPFAAFSSLILLTCALSLRSPCPPRLVLPFLPAALALTQLLTHTTQAPWQTRLAALEWLTHGATALLVYLTFRESPRLRRAALRVFVLAAGLIALASTLQNYTAPGRVWWLWDTGYQDLVFGPFVYHTKLANFAELAIPAAVWLALNEPRRRALYIFATAALAGSVVASASRGGMIILLVEFAVLSIIAGRSRLRSTLAFAAGMSLGIALFGYELAVHRWTTIDPLTDLRLPIIRSGLEMASAFLPLGAGLGTWRTVQPAFANFDVHITINQAHCDWVQWLAEGGIPMVAIMAAMVWTALRAARKEWWILGVVFVWLHGAIDYPMQQTPALTSLFIAFWSLRSLPTQHRQPAPAPEAVDTAALV